jgi:hypothetical protein
MDRAAAEGGSADQQRARALPVKARSKIVEIVLTAGIQHTNAPPSRPASAETQAW